MAVRLRPIGEQVVVITGASSGNGLVTARMAAREGAAVVLAARNGRDLAEAAERIRAEGGRALPVVADVTDHASMQRLAEAAHREFGRIDGWVNNAGVGLYGRLLEMPVEDMRRQFEVNYWGVVYGSLAAIPYLRRQGGALVNVASLLGERTVPLQGNYCATKHAVKAFSHALRMELRADRIPVSVSVVKPASIDTPLFEKARSHMGVEPQPLPPVYAPEVVARAILACLRRPIRDLYAGGVGKLVGIGDSLAPALLDRYFELTGFRQQTTDRPLAPGRRDVLYAPVDQDGGERGRNWGGPTMHRSAYTRVASTPGAAMLVAAGVGAAVVAGARALLRNGGRR